MKELPTPADQAPAPARSEPAPVRPEAETEKRIAIEKLSDSFETLFGARMGGTYADRREKGFSGDAASLFALTSLRDAEGRETAELVKVGWGEFSKETFEGDAYPAFRDFPEELYCVSQQASYFATETQAEQAKKKPAEYLADHALFVAQGGRVQESEVIDYRKLHLDREIKPVPYEDLLRTIRNQIVRVRTKPEEFATFLQELPDDPDALASRMVELDSVKWLNRVDREFANATRVEEDRKKRLLHLVWGMGVRKLGIAAGDRDAARSVLELKKGFDFETKSFK